MEDASGTAAVSLAAYTTRTAAALAKRVLQPTTLAPSLEVKFDAYL